MTPDSTMAGQTCVVTGATSGIGAVTARELAARGARVLLVGRHEGRTRSLAGDIRRDTGNPQVESLLADFSDLRQVARLARDIDERAPRLDVLINNAGLIAPALQHTPQGLELTFAVNHLAPFTLTHLLLDSLRRTPGSRVVNVASDAHTAVRRVDFDNLQAEKRFSTWGAYCLSKLGNVLFTYELARRTADQGYTVNCLHPGFVRTNIFPQGGLQGFALRLITPLMAISPDQGARTTLHLACSPDLSSKSGGYYAKSALAKSSPLSQDLDLARRLWDRSHELMASSLP